MRECELRSDAVLRCGTPVSFNVIVRPGAETGATARQQLEAWLASAGEQLSSRLEELAGSPELRGEISLDRSAFVEDSSEIKQLKEEMADRPAGVRRLAAAALSAGMNVIVAAPAEEASCRHPLPGSVAAVLPRGHERQRAGDDGTRGVEDRVTLVGRAPLRSLWVQHVLHRC